MTQSEKKRRESIAAFIKRVDGLSDSERSILKKNGGRLLKDADAAALMAFYKALGDIDKSIPKDRMFPIACMRCMWDREIEQENAIPFAVAMGQYFPSKRREKFSTEGGEENEENSSMERRMIKLLDLRWDADGILCLNVWRIAKMLKNEGKVINMVILGDDFWIWNAESKKVQCRWAEEYYRANKEEEKNAD